MKARRYGGSEVVVGRYTVREGPVTAVVDDGLEDALGRLLGPEWGHVADTLRVEGDLLLETGRGEFPRKSGDAARMLEGQLLLGVDEYDLRYRFEGLAPYTYVITGKEFGHAWTTYIADPVVRATPGVAQVLAESTAAVFEGGV